MRSRNEVMTPEATGLKLNDEAPSNAAHWYARTQAAETEAHGVEQDPDQPEDAEGHRPQGQGQCNRVGALALGMHLQAAGVDLLDHATAACVHRHARVARHRALAQRADAIRLGYWVWEAPATGARRGLLGSSAAIDFMNRYGGLVVFSVLAENPDLPHRLGLSYAGFGNDDDDGSTDGRPTSFDGIDPEEVLRKVTGVEGIPPATRVEARSARRMVEAQLGWPAA